MNGVYMGVRLDAAHITSGTEGIAFPVGCCFDLPLSFAGDTLLLPFDTLLYFTSLPPKKPADKLPEATTNSISGVKQ